MPIRISNDVAYHSIGPFRSLHGPHLDHTLLFYHCPVQ